MTDVTFTISAIPVAQPRQRHRIVNTGASTFSQNYTPTKHPVNAYKAAVAHAASNAMTSPISGPVALWLTFILPRPKGKTKKRGDNPRFWHTSRPDHENLTKSTMDAMKSIAWGDDSQVAWCNVQKLVASAAEMPRVEVRICELTSLELSVLTKAS